MQPSELTDVLNHKCVHVPHSYENALKFSQDVHFTRFWSYFYTKVEWL